jgi:diaminohydroxyphosphoribosylaminopyrimidine deaminase/5-amino-6-(5-phosphoribosylamino)uracil reductase
MDELAASLDEAIAWALVRATVPWATLEPGPRRVVHPTRPETWLELDESGGWQSSLPPTTAARDLFDLYLPLTRRPDFVIGQLGQSLDGRIATVSGRSHYITGPEDIRRLHRLRALVDAVIVGVETVTRDDPQLTVREVEGENPARVVLDPDGRLGRDRRVFTDGAARTLVVRRSTDATNTSDGRGEGPTAVVDVPHRDAAEVLTLPTSRPTSFGEGVSDGARFEPRTVLETLRAQGLRRVLVEGGGITVSRFLEAGVLDRLHLTVAPLVMGSGRPGITLPAIETLDRALRPRCRHVPLGDDMLFDLDLS